MRRLPPTARRRLIAHDAVVELASRRNGKIDTTPLRSRNSSPGPDKTALADDEMLTAIECDALPGYGGSFEKVGHRRSLVISTVCLAALVKLDRDRAASSRTCGSPSAASARCRIA